MRDYKMHEHLKKFHIGLHLLLIVIVLVGGLAWLPIGLGYLNPVHAIFQSYSRYVYNVVGVAAILLACKKDTYMPFLGWSAFPGNVLQIGGPSNANVQVKVKAHKGAVKVVYWAADISHSRNNAGVAPVDSWGYANLAITCPPSWQHDGQKHVHFRSVMPDVLRNNNIRALCINIFLCQKVNSKSMGHAQKSSSTNHKRSKRTAVIANVIVKVMNEMVNDLSSVDGEKSCHILALIKNKAGAELVKNLQDSTSELFKAIPVKILNKDISGQKYLSILGTVQPLFSVVDKNNDTTQNSGDLQQSQQETTTPETDSIVLPEEIQKIFEKNDENSELIKLAETLGSDLFSKEKFSPENMDFSNIMQMINIVKERFEDKVVSGEIDNEQITKQATMMLSKLKQTDIFKNGLPAGLAEQFSDESAIPMLINSFLGQSSATDLCSMFLPS
ncbi:hypothetical protein BDK51DRAFT_51434 [Blyttiomyces helicus]|uniref:Uncharacterized protein n=1 Tax=Blyttiomyces helicus TaxID=388810 RepID=A0A4P9WUP4_9FUNG|nr:hypothetical protein BDK51DRAFT_51434 [Blyttiomyces helicus]|eukprot:RKO94846.1 hypothetical protein BDK51DRAFT_51434 [Blyttiomyces helicus]